MRPSAASLRWRILALANAADRRRRLLQQRRKYRAVLRNNVSAFDLPEAEFIKTFRLGKAQVRALIEELTPYLTRQRRRDGISIDLKVLITLAFYATGSYQTLVGQSVFHNVAQTTVSRSVRQVTEAINRIYDQHIQWPMTPQARNAIKAQFYQRFGIPGVLGCIDGTQVAIIRPVHHEERFFNRKGYHSLNVMIICDSELNILCMDSSSPGSAHDSMVWQGHPLSRHLRDLSNEGEQVFLLGDSGYPLRATMMTPILNTSEGTPEHYYYQRQVSARNVVERCIGVLKARFRCLLVARALHYNPITAAKIVSACCVLHNIANHNRVPPLSLTRQEADEEYQRQHQVEVTTLMNVKEATPSVRKSYGGRPCEKNRQETRQGQSFSPFFISYRVVKLKNDLHTLAEDQRDNVTLNPQNRRVNPELQRGRALQQALVERLWRERLIADQ